MCRIEKMSGGNELATKKRYSYYVCFAGRNMCSDRFELISGEFTLDRPFRKTMEEIEFIEKIAKAENLINPQLITLIPLPFSRTEKLGFKKRDFKKMQECRGCFK